MSIWKEIKKAINSTLGTSDFKPLDQIITDGKGLVASDNLYYRLNSYSGDELTTMLTATMNVKGSMRIKASASGFGSSERVTVTVYKNNSLSASVTVTSTSTEVSTDFSFNAKDSIRVEAARNNTLGHTVTLWLCATPIDISGITVI